MTLLGEPPIWSYFKVKTASDSHPSKRRKHGHSGAQRTKEPEPEVKDSGKKGKKKATVVQNANDSSENDRTLFPESQAPRTPDVSSSRKGKGRSFQGFLPTPPTTNAGPSRRRNDISSPHNYSSSSSHNIVAKKKMLSSPCSTVSHDDETLLKPSDDGQLDDVEEEIQSIPSSQTRSELVLPSPRRSVALHGLRGGRSSAELDKDPPNAIKTRDSVDDNDGLLIIPSSQSQFPLCIPDDLHERPLSIKIPDARKRDIESPFTECIPSSQSQEIELTIPQEEGQYDGSRLDWKQPRSRPNAGAMYYTTNPHLKRTLSAEIFPLPVHKGFTSAIFQEEDQNDSRLNSTLPNSHQQNDLDSVTESESEDGDNRLDDPRHESRPSGNAREPSRQDTPPPQDAAYDASQEDATQGIDEASQSYNDDPPILQPGPDSQGESFESLPPDLREIFGNSDDSFPPDFPMSLR